MKKDLKDIDIPFGFKINAFKEIGIWGNIKPFAQPLKEMEIVGKNSPLINKFILKKPGPKPGSKKH